MGAGMRSHGGEKIAARETPSVEQSGDDVEEQRSQHGAEGKLCVLQAKGGQVGHAKGARCRERRQGEYGGGVARMSDAR